MATNTESPVVKPYVVLSADDKVLCHKTCATAHQALKEAREEGHKATTAIPKAHWQQETLETTWLRKAKVAE